MSSQQQNTNTALMPEKVTLPQFYFPAFEDRTDKRKLRKNFLKHISESPITRNLQYEVKFPPIAEETVRRKNYIPQISEPPPVVLDGFLLLEACGVEDPEEATEAVLGNHNIRGIVSEDLSFYVNLAYLDVGENHIVFEDLANLVSLSELHVHCNGLKRLFCPPNAFQSLEMLNLSFNSLRSDVFRELCKLPFLRQLDLSNNDITRLPTDIMSEFHALEKLALEKNAFRDTEEVFYALGMMPNLVEVNLNSNKINKVPTLSERAFPKLEVISIASNEITFFEDVCMLLTLDRLKSVVMWGNPILHKRKDLAMLFEEAVAFDKYIVIEYPNFDKPSVVSMYPRKEDMRVIVDDVLIMAKRKRDEKDRKERERKAQERAAAKQQQEEGEVVAELEEEEEGSGSAFFITEDQQTATHRGGQAPSTATGSTSGATFHPGASTNRTIMRATGDHSSLYSSDHDGRHSTSTPTSGGSHSKKKKSKKKHHNHSGTPSSSGRKGTATTTLSLGDQDGTGSGPTPLVLEGDFETLDLSELPETPINNEFPVPRGHPSSASSKKHNHKIENETKGPALPPGSGESWQIRPAMRPTSSSTRPLSSRSTGGGASFADHVLETRKSRSREGQSTATTATTSNNPMSGGALIRRDIYGGSSGTHSDYLGLLEPDYSNSNTDTLPSTAATLAQQQAKRQITSAHPWEADEGEDEGGDGSYDGEEWSDDEGTSSASSSSYHVTPAKKKSPSPTIGTGGKSPTHLKQASPTHSTKQHQHKKPAAASAAVPKKYPMVYEVDPAKLKIPKGDLRKTLAALKNAVGHSVTVADDELLPFNSGMQPNFSKNTEASQGHVIKTVKNAVRRPPRY